MKSLLGGIFDYAERKDRLEEVSRELEDPNVWTAPWIMPARVLPLRPDLEKVDEFVCEKTPDYSKYFAK